jgi:hypothetical protein
MRNDNGVTIRLTSANEGLSISLAVTGMKVAIANESLARPRLRPAR